VSLKDKKLLTLKEIEGSISTHDGFLKREMERRKEPLSCVDNVPSLAEYIGGEVISLGVGEDWAIRKEIFPGVDILLMYNRADAEFPSNLRVLYSGQKIRDVRGEDLAELTIACVNHMLRYVRQTTKDPPEICRRV
jgi:hypothetical protein